MTSAAWLKTPSGKTRGRGMGLPFPGTPGPFNAITDVADVAVGMSTIVKGDGPLIVGEGPVRTGVTAILPRGRKGVDVPCAAGFYSLNGNGEMTGTIWVEESGELETPITITNTASCGLARDSTHRWMVENDIGVGSDWGLPVTGETYDGYLNDINGFHVKQEHVFEALDTARSGPVELGGVGGGTGMSCFEFKGGNGSASRITVAGGNRYTVGAFVQANFGKRPECTILGVPFGRHCPHDQASRDRDGSIIVIIATDAPLGPHQLKKLARRVPLGIARTGGLGHDSSGDIFLAFSTANQTALSSPGGSVRHFEMLANMDVDPLYEAVIEATEEAIIDSMIANETMVGRDGNTAYALPLDRLVEVMGRFGRL